MSKLGDIGLGSGNEMMTGVESGNEESCGVGLR